MIKSMQGWKASDKNFSEYAQPGDEIDEELYFYFLEILPPAYQKSKGEVETFQVGEPADHNEKGKPIYATFQSNGKTYKYLGELATADL